MIKDIPTWSLNTLRRIGQTEEEFQHLEKWLEIEEIQAAMVSKLCRIEGRNLKDSARRMLDSMKGGGPLQKKAAFEKIALFSVIRDDVMTNFPAATELDLRNAAGKHFKQEIKPIFNFL